MRSCLFALLVAGQMLGAVNAIHCGNSATCTANWTPAAGDLVTVWAWWGIQGGGTLSDSQGNVYTQVRASDTYRSHTRGYAVAAVGGALTVTFSVAQEHIVIVGASSYSSSVGPLSSFFSAGNSANCPTTGPLSVTTPGDALLLSIWAIDSGNATKCTASTGTIADVGRCAAGGTGQVNYEMASAGMHTQQFSFLPTFNAGNGNCGLYAFPATGVPPPPPPPPPTGAGMASQLGDFAVSRTSATVLTVGANCSTATPCNARVGSVVMSVTNPMPITLSAGDGRLSLYVDHFGLMVAGSDGLTLACAGGCAPFPGPVVAFPGDSIPIWTWEAHGGTWDVDGGRDRRASFSSASVTAGIGIRTVNDGVHTVVSLDIAPPCLPYPLSNPWIINQTQHGKTNDGLSVTVYDDQAPDRHRVDADVAVNRTTLAVTVSFAVPQAGCVVIQ